MKPQSRRALFALTAISLLLLLALLFPDILPQSFVTEAQAKDASEEVNINELIVQQSSKKGLLINQFDLNKKSATTIPLPRSLREVSGLALTAEGKLLAHDDEEGTICQIDYTTGEITDYFIFTSNGKIVKDDLEGIAVAGKQVYVTNSSGTIYKFKQAANGKATTCETFPTALTAHWEIEGLTFNADLRCLIIISKNPKTPKVQGKVGIFFWSIDEQHLLEDKTILIPFKHFTRTIGKKKFKPSGIEWDRASGNYLVVAAKQRALAEIDAAGNVLAVEHLTAPWHRQMEGITFIPERGILIADEGGKGSPLLTLYPAK